VNRPAGPAGVVRAYLEALNRHQPDDIAACVTDDFVNEHTSRLGHSLVGRDAYRERLPGFLAAFRGLSYEIEDVIAAGDRVAVPYTLRAHGEGPDGVWRPVEVRGMFRFTVRDGRIAHRVDYWDSAVYQGQVDGTTDGTSVTGR